MLAIYDQYQQLIKQCEVDSSFKQLKFIIHNLEILSLHNTQKAITIFYGFLDQDYDGNNPAKYIASCIQKQGLNCLQHCYGSFIVLHFDKINAKLYLANDALGDFAVHYYQKKDSLSISDMPDVLLNKNNKSINETRVLHYFALTKPQQNGCFYQDIYQLKPGQYISFNQQEAQHKSYYHPPETLNYKNVDITQLSQQYKSLLQQVIQLQTKGQSHIGIMMSGGLDSTFVAANCLAANKKISAFSYVFPNHPIADESRWLDAMRPFDIDMHTFSGEPYWPLKSPTHISLNSPISNPYRPMKDVIYKMAENKNIKFLLTGVFADHLYTGYIYWLIDQLKKNPYVGLNSLLKISKEHGILTALRQVSPSKWSNKTKLKAPWMNKQALQILKQSFAKTYGNQHPHPQQFALSYGLETAQSNWLDNEYSNNHNLFVRHPFRDRRIVEFLMSLPAWVLGNINQPKDFVRKAAKDLLPAVIINRKFISTLQPLFVGGVLQKEINKVTELLNQSNCIWHHYIDKKLIENILKNPEQQHSDVDLLILWQCISYELWQSRLRKI